MNTALIKIIGGHFNEDREQLTLEVKVLQGAIRAVEGIYLWGGYMACFAEMESCQPLDILTHYRLVLSLSSLDEWIWEEHAKMLLENPGIEDVAFCGLSPGNYQQLPGTHKVEYIKKMIDLLDTGRVASFLKNNMRLGYTLAPVGAAPQDISRFGGLPLAPEGFEFPQDKNGQSKLFLFQLSLPELNRHSETTQQLKGEGILYFFADIYSGKTHTQFDDLSVVYADQPGKLHAVPLPDDLAMYGTFEESGLDVWAEVFLPDFESVLNTAEFTDEEEAVCRHIEAINALYNPRAGLHLLGLHNPVQGDVFFEAELKSKQLGWYSPTNPDAPLSKFISKQVTRDAVQWRHLLSFEADVDYFKQLSNFDGEFNEYMDGIFYLLIQQSDLDAMHFDNVQTVYQCT